MDDSDGKDGAVDGLGIGMGAYFTSGGVNWFGRSRKEAGDLLKEGDGEFEASHEKGAASGFGEDFGEFGRGDVVV